MHFVSAGKSTPLFMEKNHISKTWSQLVLSCTAAEGEGTLINRRRKNLKKLKIQQKMQKKFLKDTAYEINLFLANSLRLKLYGREGEKQLRRTVQIHFEQKTQNDKTSKPKQGWRQKLSKSKLLRSKVYITNSY